MYRFCLCVRLTRGDYLCEKCSTRLSLRGCLCEAASARLLLLEAASPGGSVLGRNTVRKEPEYLVLGSPESSTTSTELESSDSPYEDLEPGPGDIRVCTAGLTVPAFGQVC